MGRSKDERRLNGLAFLAFELLRLFVGISVRGSVVVNEGNEARIRGLGLL